MKPLAFATCATQPGLSANDALAATAVEARLGIEVHPAPWNLAGIRWEDFTAVVLRSTWDYHRQATTFNGWLDKIAAAGVPVLNPLALVRWNQSKASLRELAGAGVPTVPTAWIAEGEKPDLAELLARHGWRRAVIKPTVSAAAFGTWTVDLSGLCDADAARFEQQCQRGGTMVQPFVEEILTGGEWSLVFIDGRYRHAVRKRPAPGEFRVQPQYGGTWTSEKPPPLLIAGAERLLRLLAASWSTPLYVRVDLVEVGHAPGFYLVELELIEPVLFFGVDGTAADCFADALGLRLAAGSEVALSPLQPTHRAGAWELMTPAIHPLGRTR